MPILISLDGNIGAGKSTLLEILREVFPDVAMVQEPVAQWMEMKEPSQDNKHILQLFYENTERYAYMFQHTTLMTRIANSRQAMADHAGKDTVLISERSILTDRHVFAEMLKEQGKLTELEWGLYKRWYNLLTEHMPVAGVIYLTTSVDTCEARIKKRNRQGETIPRAYLEDLHKAHQKWIDAIAENANPAAATSTAASDADAELAAAANSKLSLSSESEQGFHVPVLRVSTEDGVSREVQIAEVRAFVTMLRARALAEEARQRASGPVCAGCSEPLASIAERAAADAAAACHEASKVSSCTGWALQTPVKGSGPGGFSVSAPSTASSNDDPDAATSPRPVNNNTMQTPSKQVIRALERSSSVGSAGGMELPREVTPSPPSASLEAH